MIPACIDSLNRYCLSHREIPNSTHVIAPSSVFFVVVEGSRGCQEQKQKYLSYVKSYVFRSSKEKLKKLTLDSSLYL